MKRIIRNYVVRDPKPIMDSILRGVSNYNTINFKPTINGQTVFEEVMEFKINSIDKTELYINGLRYIVNEDYNIEENKLLWVGGFELSVDDEIVLISR